MGPPWLLTISGGAVPSGASNSELLGWVVEGPGLVATCDRKLDRLANRNDAGAFARLRPKHQSWSSIRLESPDPGALLGRGSQKGDGFRSLTSRRRRGIPHTRWQRTRRVRAGAPYHRSRVARSASVLPRTRCRPARIRPRRRRSTCETPTAEDRNQPGVRSDSGSGRLRANPRSHGDSRSRCDR